MNGCHPTNRRPLTTRFYRECQCREQRHDSQRTHTSFFMAAQNSWLVRPPEPLLSSTCRGASLASHLPCHPTSPACRRPPQHSPTCCDFASYGGRWRGRSSAHFEEGGEVGRKIGAVGVLPGHLRHEGFEGALEVARGLDLPGGPLLLFVLHAHRDGHEVVEQHRHADLQHHPHAEDDEAADEERRPPHEVPVGPERRQRVDPGVAGGDAEEGDEGAVELAELVRRDVGEERHPEDGICGAAGLGGALESAVSGGGG